MKKNVLKKWLVSLLVATTLLSAVACTAQGDNPSDSSSDTTATQGVTEGSQASEGQTEAVTTPDDFVVTEEGKVAHVTTSNGFTYDLSGYSAIEGGVVTFKKDLTVTFTHASMQEKFNRFTMTYQSSAPIKVYMTYQKGTLTMENDFYVEAGKGDFSGLLKNFLGGNQADALVSFRVDTCENKNATFVLENVAIEVMEVPNETLYISNDTYKLGVDLTWGGTINFVKDLNCPVGGVTNLVNKHDTGRLIQQSFYGTPGVAGVYQPSKYGEVQWPYNPVQGGDQYGNASRLIDLVIGENYVYIKSQPQDWSLDNALTPSYMENTYTLEKDYIRVDNRFVDFSGWEHPYTSQELPALYTISYLDTFVWYNGESAWTGDVLSSRNDLNFWGDPNYAADCRFPIREKNTETWCAWINSEKDYGLGLYVPNVDVFCAGRYEYNGTKKPTDDPTNYVAPVNTIKLVSFEALEYSYLLTTGTTQEIRDTFTANKDFSTNESLHKNYTSTRLPSVEGDITQLDFSSNLNVNLLMNPVNTTVAYDATEKAVKLTSGSLGDSSVTIPYSTAPAPLNAEDYTTLRIEYMIPTTNKFKSYQCDFFICTGANLEPSEAVRYRKTLVADGQYHVLEVQVSKLSYWSGVINKIRFDYFDAASDGDVIYVKSITLS